MKDILIRGTSLDGSIRFFCASTAALVDEARRIHKTTPVATAALGRMLTAGSLMGAMLKNEKESITLQINGKGPAGTILVVSDFTSDVRGYINNPNINLGLNKKGKLDVGGAVGTRGSITIIKDLGLKEPYIGSVPIVNGEIGEDLTSYFVISEQTATSVGLGVRINSGGVDSAGGFIIQVMPEASNEIVSILEGNIEGIDSVTDVIASKGVYGMLNELLNGIPYTILDKKEIHFKCKCDREKIEKILISLGSKEIKDMIEEEGQGEVVCHFCNQNYLFSRNELLDLLNESQLDL